MILNLVDFKSACKKILDAVDTNSMSVVSEILELKTVYDNLTMSVTNGEYYVRVTFPLDTNAGELHAIVSANLFLKLVSKITTTEIELTVEDNILKVKGNGTYKLPLVCDVTSLPVIKLDNFVNSFTVENTVLKSILKYNSKELLKSGLERGSQKLFYIDNNGAITYTGSCACVNSFAIPNTFKIALKEKIVKLFKLFDGESINFAIGHDETPSGVLQTKVLISDDKTSLVVIVSTGNSLESTLNNIPTKAIRTRAFKNYDYSVCLDKNLLLDAVTRLSLFQSSTDEPTIPVTFGFNQITIYDFNKNNSEKIYYVNECAELENNTYELKFDVNDFRITLENCDEQYITIKFGDKSLSKDDAKAVVIERGNIKNIIQEKE